MRIYSVWVENEETLGYEDWNMHETASLIKQLNIVMMEHTLAIL